MPQWGPPPQFKPNELLDESWMTLLSVIEKGPSFEEVTGVPIQQMQAHAVQAAQSFATFGEEHQIDSTIEQLMLVYTLGFIVGMRYGELRHAQASTE